MQLLSSIEIDCLLSDLKVHINQRGECASLGGKSQQVVYVAWEVAVVRFIALDEKFLTIEEICCTRSQPQS